jgi:maltooligosyltrehalose trehalohydrolase
MERQPLGYFEHALETPDDSFRYAYRLANGQSRPDPASRWQPEGVHKPSALYFPEVFDWSTTSWRGVPRDDLVIYELHVGTFTQEGTFDAVIPRLAELRDLGITALELMPVAQFPGGRNWGYDGVHPYAAQNTYGGPHALQRLIDAAHARGLAVLLDVVYNHFGPEGSYLAEFGPYFTGAYHTPWGAAVNYDGYDSDPVRRFVIDNAVMWVRDFRCDGLRLDAIQNIFDFGPRHILAELQQEVQAVAQQQHRCIHVIGETDQNDARQITPAEQGGLGLDAVWSDDFHHALHAFLTRESDGYYADFGSPHHVVKSFNDAFVYDGSYSAFRRRRAGSPVGNTSRTRFVICTKNHDQVGNRPLGDRPATYLTAAQQRLWVTLMLVSPFVPLIFMGEEYAESRPFPFFCSFEDPQLVESVRAGRRREFEELQFHWKTEFPDPQSNSTFDAARLSWSWPLDTRAAGIRTLHRDLLHARRTWQGLRDRDFTHAALLSPVQGHDSEDHPILQLERGPAASLVIIANLSGQPIPPPPGAARRSDLLLSSEATAYGGTRSLPCRGVDGLLPHEALVFGPGERIA